MIIGWVVLGQVGWEVVDQIGRLVVDRVEIARSGLGPVDSVAAGATGHVDLAATHLGLMSVQWFGLAELRQFPVVAWQPIWREYRWD